MTAPWQPPAPLPEHTSMRDLESLKLLDAPAPAAGGRRYALRDLAHAMARLGASNHEIVATLEDRADAWRVLPRTNLWQRYDVILTDVQDARAATARRPFPPQHLGAPE